MTTQRQGECTGIESLFFFFFTHSCVTTTQPWFRTPWSLTQLLSSPCLSGLSAFPGPSISSGAEARGSQMADKAFFIITTLKSSLKHLKLISGGKSFTSCLHYWGRSRSAPTGYGIPDWFGLGESINFIQFHPWNTSSQAVAPALAQPARWAKRWLFPQNELIKLSRELFLNSCQEECSLCYYKLEIFTVRRLQPKPDNLAGSFLDA